MTRGAGGVGPLPGYDACVIRGGMPNDPIPTDPEAVLTVLAALFGSPPIREQTAIYIRRVLDGATALHDAQTFNAKLREAAGASPDAPLVEYVRSLRAKADVFDRHETPDGGMSNEWTVSKGALENALGATTSLSAIELLKKVREAAAIAGTLTHALGYTPHTETLVAIGDEHTALEALIKVLGGRLEDETTVAAAARLCSDFVASNGAEERKRLRELLAVVGTPYGTLGTLEALSDGQRRAVALSAEAAGFRDALRGALGDDHPVFDGDESRPTPLDMVGALARMVDESERKAAAASREADRLKSHIDFFEEFKALAERLNAEAFTKAQQLEGRETELLEAGARLRRDARNALRAYTRKGYSRSQKMVALNSLKLMLEG